MSWVVRVKRLSDSTLPRASSLECKSCWKQRKKEEMGGGKEGADGRRQRGKEIKSLEKSPHILLAGKGTLLGTCHAAFQADTVSVCPLFFQSSNFAKMHHV